jgi:hypothetical protein
MAAAPRPAPCCVRRTARPRCRVGPGFSFRRRPTPPPLLQSGSPGAQAAPGRRAGAGGPGALGVRPEPRGRGAGPRGRARRGRAGGRRRGGRPGWALARAVCQGRRPGAGPGGPPPEGPASFGVYSPCPVASLFSNCRLWRRKSLFSHCQ